jgi:hypothetical protein
MPTNGLSIRKNLKNFFIKSFITDARQLKTLLNTTLPVMDLRSRVSLA